MKRITKPSILLSLCALAGFSVMALTSQAASMNSSEVDLVIIYTFSGANFTDSGLPAEVGVDYEFDGPPSHFYDNVQTFVFSLGDGIGSVSGSAMIGSETHTYPDDPNDFTSFDPFTDDVTLTLSTMGQSSTPGSNGSAAIESALSFFVSNFTEDPNNLEPESLTFSFDYSFSFDMTLVEEAPAGGEGNGFIEVDAELIEDDAGTTFHPDIVDELRGGPANIVNQTDSGQIQFVTTPGDFFAELFIMTNVNSTTLVPVPEPASLALLSVGVLMMMHCRRH